jgi:hypothetical protein
VQAYDPRKGYAVGPINEVINWAARISGAPSKAAFATLPIHRQLHHYNDNASLRPMMAHTESNAETARKKADSLTKRAQKRKDTQSGKEQSQPASFLFDRGEAADVVRLCCLLGPSPWLGE